MKIGHCIHGVGLGGAQQVIRHLVAARDPDVEHVVLASMSGVFHQQIEDAGARVRIVPRRLPKIDPFYLRGLRLAMIDEAVDVVHTHLFGDTLHGYVAARRAGIPALMTLHNVVEARSRLQRAGYRWLLGQPITAVACAEFVRRSFLDHADVEPQRIETIQNAIGVPEIERSREAGRRVLKNDFGIEADDVVFAGIGRMVPQKAFHLMIEAVAALDDGHATPRLVLFGKGDLEAQLRQRVRELGAESRVIFAGFRGDIPELLPAIDVVVFSSFQEGLPMALLEAMVARRALVATTVGGIPEALDDDREALLVEPGNLPALRDALQRVLDDGPLRQRLGTGAEARFHRDFSAHRMARAYEAIYRRLANAGHDAKEARTS